MVAVKLIATKRKKMRILKTNYKKLKMTRRKLKLSLAKASEETGIPPATLQRYEEGITHKISLEILKRLSEYYGTDYYMYFWWTRFTSLSDIILHFIYFPEDFSEDRKLFEILDITEYFDFDTKAGTYISLYNKLTEEEKEDFYRFKNVVINTLKSDKYFTNDELEKEDIFLFCYFFAHKVKREKKVDLEILKRDKL